MGREGREGAREGGQPSYLDDRAEDEHDEEDDGDEAFEDVHDFFSLSALCACEERCVKRRTEYVAGGVLEYRRL